MLDAPTTLSGDRLSLLVLGLGSGVPEVTGEVFPFRLAGPYHIDFLILFQEVSPGPVDGRLTSFVHLWRAIRSDAFLISVTTHGYLIFPTPDFPGVLRELTFYPRKV